MNFYDPYKIKDPTIPPAIVIDQGRTVGGKFTGNHIEYTSQDMYPIESNYWRSAANGAYNALAMLLGMDYKDIPERILPNAVINEFSWRMICEMVEAALDQARKDKTDLDAMVQAAHDHLAKVQAQIGVPA